MEFIAAGRHKKKKGSSRMKEFGYKKIEVWLDVTEATAVILAADRANQKLATWVRKVAVAAATKGN